MPTGSRKCNNSACDRKCICKDGKYQDVCNECWKLTPHYDNWIKRNKKGKYKEEITDNTEMFEYYSDLVFNEEQSLESSETIESEKSNIDKIQLINLYASLELTSKKFKSDMKLFKKLLNI
jgi:hypothetical protein